MYNRRNWRDILSEKSKNMTRVDYEIALPEPDDDYVTTYRINRAKRSILRFNDLYRDGKTELFDERHIMDPATQIHHIFLFDEFPMIAVCSENLISLTSTQHYSYAHPNNNTQYVDKDYQYLCLTAKTGAIRDNLMGNTDKPIIYDFYLYQNVLNAGLNTEEFFEVQEMDFNGLLNRLEKYYE